MKRKDLLKGLTPEQIKKLKACKNRDDLLTLAKDEGIELTPEQLEAVSGGGALCHSSMTKDCKWPNCDGVADYVNSHDGTSLYKCRKCGKEFWD